MRDEWLAAIAVHVQQVEEGSGDPLDPVTLEVARNLAGVLGEDPADLPGWHLLGRFHMHRDNAIYATGEDGWQADNQAMTMAFARYLLRGPSKPDGLEIPADVLEGAAVHASAVLNGLADQAHRAQDAETLAALPVMWQRITSALPAGSKVRPVMLANVCLALLNRYLIAGDLYDLDAAVSVGQQAVATAADDDPELPAIYHDLTRALTLRFERSADRADIDGAIASIEQAMTLSATEAPPPARYLSSYANSLLLRFNHAGDLADLNNAIDASRLAVLVADDDDRPYLLRAVAIALVRRFDATANKDDLDHAIFAFRHGLDLIPADSDARPAFLAGLGNGLRTRFGLTFDAEDLDEAVSMARQSVAEARDTHHPERPLYLDGLGIALTLRTALGGGPQDADEAVAACREAVATIGTTHHLRPQLLNNLSAALKARSATLADIDEAITLVREAVSLALPGHADRGRFLLGLCSALLDRFWKSDDPADIAEAVTVGRQMLEAIPPAHSNRGNALFIFGEALRQQAYLPGAAAGILDEAVTAMRQAVAATPPGGARANVLASLGVTLRQRFRRTKDPNDLDGSVTVFQEAARESGADSADPSLLDDLATSLLLRYERENDADDFSKALTARRQALAIAAADQNELPRYQSGLSEVLQLAFSRTGQRADIDEAVTLSRQAVEMTPTGDPNLRDYQLILGKALDAQAKSQVSDGPRESAGASQGSRSEAAARLEALVDIRTTAELPRVLDPAGLADALRLADLITVDDEPDLDTHALLGRYFWLRHRALPADPDRDSRDEDGDVPDDSRFFAFSATIDFHMPLFAAGRWTPPGFEPYVAAEVAEGALEDLFTRVALSMDVTTLTEAIALWRRILDAVPVDHPGRGVYASALGTALHLRFAVTGSRADLHECLATLREAVPVIPADHPLLPAFKMELSDALRLTAELDGLAGASTDALDVAVATAREAVEGTTAGTVEHAFARVQLGQALVSRHTATGDTADLDEGITHLSEGTTVIPDDMPGGATAIRALSVALYFRFTLTTDQALLDAAIHAARRVVAILPEGHPDLAQTLVSLGVALRDRAQLCGSVDNLTEAVDVLTQAVQAAAPSSPFYASSLGALSQALLTRFTLARQVADLDASIDLARKAIAAVPSGSDPTGLTTLLGDALLARSEWSGSKADLDAGLEIARQAASTGARTDLATAEHLRTAAAALQMQYLRTEEPGLLDESVETARRALAATADGDPNTPLSLIFLAGALRLRCQDAEDDDGLEEAIELARRAVATAPPGYALGPMFAGELAATLFTRFVLSEGESQSDLDEAVRWFRTAIASSQESPRKAEYQVQLAAALELAHELHGLARDRDEALSLYARAAESAASPVLRINAARLGADFAADFAPDAAADLLETAVRLLPLAASRQLSRSDQQHALEQFALLSNEAAELALTAGGPGAPARALSLLELSRAVLHGQALDTRRDLLDLQAAHPALATRFVELRDLLDAPDALESKGGASVVLGSPLALTQAVLREGNGLAASGADGRRPGNGPDRFQANRDFSVLLDQIRQQPGFESFLLPPPPAELTRQAAQGPIVAFNIGRSRCDALIVVPSGVEHVPLPALNVEELVSQIDLWEDCIDLITDKEADIDARSEAEGFLGGALEWLWDVAVEPVLRHLGYTKPPEPGQPWPRVWWTPGGLLGMLPIHAAGYHRTHSGATVLDRVVSSYTSTVRALSYARERARTAPPTRSLIVAMPATPGGLTPLPGASAEVSVLRSLLPNSTVLEEEDAVTERTPTRDRVLSELTAAGIAHFACHAASQPDDPSSSQIYLHDHVDRPFTVATLLPARLQPAQLAFLSACETARSENFDLLDEAIHLTSAFQLAGFPHVIGTLWPIDDTISAQISADFYGRLQSELRTLTVANSAQALHDTIRDLRGDPGNSAKPSVWAAHIHAGA